MLAFLLIPALIGVGRAGIEIPRWDVHKLFSQEWVTVFMEEIYFLLDSGTIADG